MTHDLKVFFLCSLFHFGFDGADSMLKGLFYFGLDVGTRSRQNVTGLFLFSGTRRVLVKTLTPLAPVAVTCGTDPRSLPAH